MSSTTNPISNTGQRRPDFLPPHLQPRASQSNSNGNGNAAIQANLNSTTGSMTNTTVQVIVPATQETGRGRDQTQGTRASQKQLTNTTDGSSKDQGNKQSGARGPVGGGEKQRRKRLGLCAYCGSESHTVEDCRKRAFAEKYKSSVRDASKPPTKAKFNTSAPSPAPKDQAGRAAFSKQWKDVAENFGKHDDWVKSSEGFEALKKKQMEEEAVREKEKREVEKPKYRTTFKETTRETVDGKLGGVRKVKRVEKS